MNRFPREGLTPEQQKAIAKLEECFPKVDQYVIPRLQPSVDVLCVTDKIMYVPDMINTADLPRTKTWLWNQSRGRQPLRSYNNDISLSFYKVTTRKAKNCNLTPPPCKLWVFNINRASDNKVLSIIWCERGLDYHCIDDITVEELSFLKPFIDEKCAQEFGWKD